MAEDVKVCPECGVDLYGRDPYAHALSHWPEYLDPAKASKTAMKRQTQCVAGGVSPTAYDKAHEGG